MSETNTNPEARDVIADWLVDHDVNPPRGKSINDLAGTIIAALAAEGMVIVPREPTDEMITAMSNADECGYSAPHVGNYKDMYRAALCRADSSASSPAIASSRCHHSTAEGRDDR